MTTDFRALLAELADELDHNRQCLMDDRSLTHPLADRARAALAEPEPPAVAPATWLPMEQAPRDGTKILGRAGDEISVAYWSSGIAPYWCLAVCGAYAEDGEWNPTEWQPIPNTVAVPTIAPVSVSERLPGPEDCDAEGRCWMHGKVEGDWRLINTANPGVPRLNYCFSHWLPAIALPLPTGDDA